MGSHTCSLNRSPLTRRPLAADSKHRMLLHPVTCDQAASSHLPQVRVKGQGCARVRGEEMGGGGGPELAGGHHNALQLLPSPLAPASCSPLTSDIPEW